MSKFEKKKRTCLPSLSEGLNVLRIPHTAVHQAPPAWESIQEEAGALRSGVSGNHRESGCLCGSQCNSGNQVLIRSQGSGAQRTQRVFSFSVWTKTCSGKGPSTGRASRCQDFLINPGWSGLPKPLN